MEPEKLIYDWNAVGQEANGDATIYDVEFDDETLRDGLQSPSARDPSIEDKLEILHLMADLGVDAADLGLAGASQNQRDHVKRLVQEIVDHDLAISPGSAGRTVIGDIQPICEIGQEVGIPVEVQCFIGSSPIRQFVEGWKLDVMLQITDDAVSFAVREGMPVMYVTEDTTRASPQTVRRLYTTAIEAGARRICAADTVGHATPEGVQALITFMKGIVEDTGEDVAIDWHGHCDRGLSIENAFAAVRAGADRIHGTALGIGERTGNTPLDLLLVNARLQGWIDNDLSRLCEYCEKVSEVTGIPIQSNYPVVGQDAFRTATGVHASAVIKALRKGNDWLADRVYSSVPAGMVGRRQKIEIGPMSGSSNVVHWLEEHGWEPTDGRVEAIFTAAKASDHVLSDFEVVEILNTVR